MDQPAALDMNIRMVDSPITPPPAVPGKPPNTAALIRYRLDTAAMALVCRIVKAEKDQYEIEPEITVFNKKCNQPRDIQFRSNESRGYFYSGQVARAKPLTVDLMALLDLVNRTTGAKYNAILINRYKNGSKNVGAHADSKEALDDTAGVFAITYGATRNFRVRDIKSKAVVRNVMARHGEALQMAGNFQNIYTHEIPKELTIHEERISFTFRKHDPAAEAAKFAAHDRKVAAEAAQEVKRAEAKQLLQQQLAEKKQKQALDEEHQARFRVNEKRKRDEEEVERAIAKKACEEEAAAKKAKAEAAAEAAVMVEPLTPAEKREFRRRLESIMTAPMPADLPTGTTQSQWLAMNEDIIREMIVEERK